MKNPKNFFELTDHLRSLMKPEGYSKSYSAEWNCIIQKFSDYWKCNSLTEYSPDIGKSMIEYLSISLNSCPSRIENGKRIITILNRLQLGIDGRAALWTDQTVQISLPTNLKKVLNSFISECEKKGNSPATLHYKSWICSRFMKNLSEHGVENVTDITGELVQISFLELKYSRYWDKIGPFLSFLCEKKYITNNYSKLITYRKKHCPHPTVYTVDEITKVLMSIDTSTKTGIRNYAIVLLLSKYGIRSRDIASLTFDNVDFKDNRIRFIQKKTGVFWECELFSDVKIALQRYIRESRAAISECKNIFLTTVIPYRPLKCGAIDEAIGVVFSKSDIFTKDKRHGSRSFRSSIASNMINDNISTEVVRNVLGHSTKQAITHYAKLDMVHMRLCSLPAFPPSGNFAEILTSKAGEADV